jgi:DMSO/TMAO reductase YedYZ molybdopterin-dependent catalytic subunit
LGDKLSPGPQGGRSQEGPAPSAEPFTRRAFLIGAAASLVGCSSERPRRGLLGLAERWNDRVQRRLFDPHRLAPQLPPAATTPSGEFPTYYISPSVPVAPPGWRLRVGGMVARAGSFSLAELQRMPRTDLRVRHHCVEGWSAVASWHGVRLRDLAEIVGADPRAPFVEFRSFDSGYYSTWDVASALHRQTILAYAMNGEPLLPDYGAPLRLYSAVKLGYKMVKYLTEVTFLPTRSDPRSATR